MWGGRFESGPAAVMEEINASIEFDKRLAGMAPAGSKKGPAARAAVHAEEAAPGPAGAAPSMGEMLGNQFKDPVEAG